jgi:hypothetical protein
MMMTTKMRLILLMVISCVGPFAYAGTPLTISAPDATINSPVSPNSTQVVHYTVRNSLTGHSITVTGVTGTSGFVSQTNNCGALGPQATCTITMAIAPTSSDAGSSVTQALTVNNDGFYPITSAPFTVAVNNNFATLTISALPYPLLTVGGNIKQFTVNNTSTYDAQNFSVSVSGSTGVTVGTPSCGTTLPANSACTVTVTPPVTGGSAAGAAAMSGTLSASASNVTTAASETLYLLNYANIYNDGYIYSLTDPVSLSGSVTGSVAAEIDIASTFTWATATAPSVSTDNVNGAANQTAMITLSPNLSIYPAQQACYNYRSTNNLSGWYLPAICELGVAGSGGPGSCSNGNNNMVVQVFDRGLGGFTLGTFYWSSSQHVPVATKAYYQLFDVTSAQNSQLKNSTATVRCARVITYPST